jgi:gluconate 5-dehydrogenase
MTHSLFDLTGRTALVTGSSRGLGFAIAEGLAQAGARLVLNGLDKARVQSSAAALRAQGYTVEEAAFDATDEQAVMQAFAALDAAGIAVDIVVNNAGIQLRKPLVDFTLEEWDKVLRTNLTSAFLVGREAAKRMIAAKRGGKVINISSINSEVARATITPYTTAKGGIKMLTRGMAAEWAEHNIQANAIGPGYMVTDMNAALINNPTFDTWVKARTPSRRWGKPEELVGAAIFLASAASNYVNGHTIYVDGGLLSAV